MNRPGFFEGVGVALAASVVVGVLFTVLAPLFGSADTLRALTAVTAFAYLLYLLCRSNERVGRITCVLVWLVAAAVLAWSVPTLPAYAASHLSILWLVRSLYFHGSGLAALADLGLTAFSLAAAVWALYRTGSVFGATWCLFLVQALFTFIPTGRGERELPNAEPDRFQSACRAAQAAVQRLSEVS